MTRPPNFHELFEEPLPEEERDRLLAAHDLVVEAGPPPEVPPWLEQPPTPWLLPERAREPRRRRWAVYALAATLAALAFLAGYVSHGRKSTLPTAFVVNMHGTALAPNAKAAIQMGRIDAGGNWPMILRVTGLKQLPKGDYYELFLTKQGKLGPSCGTFRVTPPATDVRLNAPYKLKQFDGWIVTRHTAKQVLLTT